MGDDMYLSVDKYHGDFEMFKKNGSKYKHQGSLDVSGKLKSGRNSKYDKKL